MSLVTLSGVLNWVKDWDCEDKWEVALVPKESRFHGEDRVIVTDNCSNYDKNQGGAPTSGYGNLEPRSSLSGGTSHGRWL